MMTVVVEEISVAAAEFVIAVGNRRVSLEAFYFLRLCVRVSTAHSAVPDSTAAAAAAAAFLRGFCGLNFRSIFFLVGSHVPTRNLMPKSTFSLSLSLGSNFEADVMFV